MGADLLRRPAVLLTERVWVPDTVLSGTMKGYWTQEGYEEPYDIRGQTMFCPSIYVDFRPLGLTGGEENYFPFVSTPRPQTRISPSMRVFQRASGSSIGHTQTPISCMLNADLSTDHRPSTSPE